ncbi:MAG: DUF3300 domain-containing protein, partial [Tepidisphaeraceae bacterium]
PPPQEPVYSQPNYAPPPGPAPAVEAAPASDDAAMQELVAPVALYPDPLLAVLLPASTFPDQIQQAAAWQQANQGAPDYAIAQQPWDPSVQAMVHYPSVLQYMNGDIQWTASLGSAVAANQGAVMAAIQELRAQAYSSGSLASTAQMDVMVEGSTIYIEPADPNYICVPAYDPVYAYQQRQDLSFGPQYAAGAWLYCGVDWGQGNIYQGDWHDGWQRGGRGWQRDPNWQPQAQHEWVRQQRYGPPPQVRPQQYALPQAVRAHAQDFKPAPAVHGGPISPAGRAVGFQSGQPPEQQSGQGEHDEKPMPVAEPSPRPGENPGNQQNQEYRGQPILNPRESGNANAPAPKPPEEQRPAPGPGAPQQPGGKEPGNKPGGPGAPGDQSKKPQKPPEGKPDEKSGGKPDQQKDQGQDQNQDQSKYPTR